MTDTVDMLCNSVHEKLETLQGRLESLKLNIGTTCHMLQEKLVEVRKKSEDKKPAVAEARIKLELWIRENRSGKTDPRRSIPAIARARTARFQIFPNEQGLQRAASPLWLCSPRQV